MKRFFDDGAVVLFQGDSITDSGRNREKNDLGMGYPKAVGRLYDFLFPDNEVTFVNRGISGNRARDLLTRYHDDFLKVKPDFLSILIGINDTWRKYDNNDETPLVRFAAEYEELLKKIKKDMPKTKIMLIAPFVTHALPDRALWHEDLDPKVVTVYELAKKYADFLLPLDAIFDNAVKSGDFTSSDIAADGVHPSALGHAFIASEYLKLLKIL